MQGYDSLKVLEGGSITTFNVVVVHLELWEHACDKAFCDNLLAS